ncbi:hypothetical protein FOCG_15453 [Fusarium oxysporum f. sp. radicis-lycopersici 26381]|uniref:DUF4238 domain-containing protein n=2 Tax=Fusarium oxysporum TaxID=5507 RepID=A0A4Q2VE21_FUSOX|nr:hypothetical protein FOCG_15453 [Fusarium oxysporum f. sp. radicis-lycopersici 26381]RKK10069.1 hypothetical protein BFJ65_g15372 [Fusarium oxysporum f. sp. cepae]RKK33830.1 hypothetical protein BFJ67_g14070 [Fusarium oxysporum f. sp. cepae]RKK39137.1 hypothetical protein BFJ66_g12121 [Fusarium oxysporum f. sp. cepae]RYC85362.1 hypothetical protein BFJ63_vAg11786 [Fusarium oxysporum f. sp. narcissi]
MSADAPQYQHFIPQFILKNFDHPFSCPKAPTNGSKCKKHHHEKGKYPGDRDVNCLELLPEGFKVEELSIRQVCGLDDMYTDQSPNVKFPRELEAKFSRLESETSAVIRRIISSHQRGEEYVKINRTQQTVLRKFIYLLNQRGSGFFKTYNCNSINDYKKIDRDLLKEYMDRNGIERPLDIWLQGLFEFYHRSRYACDSKLARNSQVDCLLWLISSFPRTHYRILDVLLHPCERG